MTIDTRTGMDILEPDQCWALLRTATVGRLAVVVGDQPDIFPVNHVVDHGTVVFRTAEGTKLAAAVLGRAVAFEVDGTDRDQAWSVVIKGRAREIGRMTEVVAATELPLYPWATWPKPRFVRVEADSVTGRRFPVVSIAGPVP